MEMNRFIAAIDQGTTSTRCILFNQDGSVKVLTQKEHTQHYPQPGWVEHDPLEVWQRTQEVIREAITKSAVTPGEISAIGITNQRETTVLWDRRSGKPFTNAIVWQDTHETHLRRICQHWRHRSVA
jgi:glycerol kinase